MLASPKPEHLIILLEHYKLLMVSVVQFFFLGEGGGVRAYSNNEEYLQFLEVPAFQVVHAFGIDIVF